MTHLKLEATYLYLNLKENTILYSYVQITVLSETKEGFLTVLCFFFSFLTSGIFSFCGNEGHIFGHMVDRNRTDPGYPDYQITPFVMSQDKHFLSKLDINLRPDVSKIVLGLELLCVTLLSTICQLYHCCQFYW